MYVFVSIKKPGLFLVVFDVFLTNVFCIIQKRSLIIPKNES